MMSRNFSQMFNITESLIIKETTERIQIKCHLLNQITPPPHPPNPINATQQTLIPKDRKVVAMETTQACFHPPIDEVLCEENPCPTFRHRPLVLHSRRPDAVAETRWRAELFGSSCFWPSACNQGQLLQVRALRPREAGRLCVV